jgi:16S rRNA (adenine(1408)-N(1))-methyltransferase
LLGVADEVTVFFPWGSLLRGVLGWDERVLAGVAALLAPGGVMTTLFSVVARDGVPGLRDDVATVYAAAGLSVGSVGAASVDEVAASRSSWAKRLRAGGAARPVTRLVARRESDPSYVNARDL